MLEREMEIEQLINLSSGRVVKFYESHLMITYMDTQYQGLVLEKCDSDLFCFVKKLDSSVSIDRLRFLCKEILLAYHKCYTLKIGHRDVKPKNILINEAPLEVKLCDFSLSRSFENTQSTKTIIVSQDVNDDKTTYIWASPEMLNYQSYDITHDLWGIGCLIYFVFSLGKPLFTEPRDLLDPAAFAIQRCGDHVEKKFLAAAVAHLVCCFTQLNPKARFSPKLGLTHPALWSADQTANFVRFIVNENQIPGYSTSHYSNHDYI